MTRSKIIGTGMSVPKNIMTNDDLAKVVDTSDEWIRERTGISQRHISKNGETCVSLAAEASKQAIKRALLQPLDIELIIMATLSPDRMMPSAACEVSHAVGCGDAAAFDITAACSGFVFALSVADQFIRNGTYKNILCIGAEQLSPYINWEDRTTCVLFGDGAGAAVVTATSDDDESQILSTHMYSNGSYGDLLCIPASGSKMAPSHPQFSHKEATIQMEGKDLFRMAVTSMIKAGQVALQANGMSAKDIDLFIPHQANKRILNAVAERLSVPQEKIMVNLDRYGNTSAATIPIALHEAVIQGRCKKGDLVLLDAFGGGLTYGSCLLRL